MTTTLSEGVKVPDVGSTDWADDLETNWNLLNTALAQQGSWAKVNEAQTFTGVQTFSDGIVGSLQGTANMAVSDEDGNSITTTYATKTELSTLSDTVGTKANDSDVVHKTGAETIAGAKTFSDTLTSVNVVPSATDTYSLGSASVQYNAIYGKSYFYNGVQWGLDQNNTWTGENTYTSYIKSIGQYRSDIWSGNARDNLYLMSNRDTEDVSGWLVNTFRSNDAQGTALHIYGWDFLENGIRYSGLRFKMIWNAGLNNGSGGYYCELMPNEQGTNPCTYLKITNLKNINGINPGALSFPDMSQGTDIKPYITNVSGAASANLYTPVVDGWVIIKGKADSNYSIYIYDREAVNNGMAASAYGNGSQGSGRLVVSMPVRAGRQIGIVCIQGSTDDIHSATFIPNLGNV